MIIIKIGHAVEGMTRQCVTAGLLEMVMEIDTYAV